MRAFIPVRVTEKLPLESGQYLTDIGEVWYDSLIKEFKSSKHGAVLPPYAMRHWYKEISIDDFDIVPKVIRMAGHF